MAEFTNIVYDIEKTLRHCFRQQAARCHEYLIFLDRMKKKYPTVDLVNVSANNGQLPFVTTNNWKNVENQLKNVDELEQKDRGIFAMKYTRMLVAKKLFERLGGDYQNFQ